MIELSVDKLLSWSLYPEISEQKLINGISDISHLYTQERDELTEWKWNESLITSYTCFYLPTNFQKFRFVLDRLPKSTQSELSELDWIDFGCGPGTYTLGILDYFPEFKGQVSCIDKESFMLEQARRVIRGAFPDRLTKVSFQNNIREVSSEGSVLLFGNSLNEMSAKEVLQTVTRLKPKYIILIEPGTPEVFYKLMDIRKTLSSRSFKNIFPCPTGVEFCPVYTTSLQEEKIDWCHQVMKTVHHPSVERLSQKAKLDRKKMPLIGHVYFSNDVEGDSLEENHNMDEKSFRVIRTITETKHSFLWDVCLNDNKTLRFEIPKRKMKKPEIKELGMVCAGDKFSYEVVKEIDDRLWRVNLI